MPLFANPQTLATKVFAFQAQTSEKNSTVGTYVESAASLASESRLVVKHDSSKVPRHLVQRSVKRVPAADAAAGLRRITVNVTVTADPLFSDAEVATEVAVITGALGVTDFTKNLMLGMH